MVKKLIILIFLITNVNSDNSYESNCVKCHRGLPISLQRIFMKYLLVYGGEKNMKAGLKHYLKYPSRDISVMSYLFIRNYGIKSKTTLSDNKLDEILDIYWDKFKIFGKLK